MLQNAKPLWSTIPGQASNAPTGTGEQTQYFADATRRQIREMAKYATDYFAAQVQGLDTENPDEQGWYEIRVADVFSSLGISSTSKQDDWKNVFFRSPAVDYVPMGTKFFFWNNVWLADNPSNIASVAGNALVRRCNTVWNSLDYYGNIVSEPFVIANIATKANANTDTEFMKLADAYSDCVMQANEWTLANLRENTRIVLGTGVYAVRGLANYIREFTNDATSVRLIHFSMAYQEPGETDDMVNQVANGLAFSWEITADVPRNMTVGQTATISPASIRNGETPTVTVSYIFESLTPEIATVSSTGDVETISVGQAQIKCTLEQNPNISTTFTIEVADAAEFGWASSVPTSLPQFTSVTLITTQNATWTVTGGMQNSFDYTTTDNSITITCYYPVDIPITVTATNGTETLTVTIALTAK